MSAKKTGVIFDMDGVLVDSEPVIEAAATMALAEYGVQAKPEDFVPFVGQGEIRYIGGVSAKHGVPYRPEMKTRVYEIYLEIVADRLKVYPGARDLLKRLRDENRPFALASSADRIKVDANLRVARIPTDWFVALIAAEDVSQVKPAPDIFLEAARRMGIAPEDCCVIEDALSGIQAARAAEMRSIAVATSFDSERLSQENPDLICESIEGVYSALEGLMD